MATLNICTEIYYMKKVLVKIIRDGEVEETREISEKTMLELTGIEDFTEDEVDGSIDVLAECMPGAFANSEGKVSYTWEFIDADSENES